MNQKRKLEDLEQISEDFKSTNAICRQLYEQNQQKQSSQQQKPMDQIEQKNNFQQSSNQDEEEQVKLDFTKGQFCLNQLTQYPTEDKKNYMISFVNLLYENINCDVKRDRPEKTLISALMTTYGFEEELLEPIAKAKVKFVLVNDQSNNPTKDGYKNWTLIMPKKSNQMGVFQGAFHPKIWLLKFPEHLRIVIGSQNLHVADWAVWSQCLWIQDFPIKTVENKVESDAVEFKQILSEFLRTILPAKCNFEEMLDLKLDDYDISSVGIRLITSIPGRYTGNELYKYGQMRAYSIIFEELQRANLKPIPDTTITYQTTSLGVFDEKNMQYFCQNFSGKPITNKPTNQKVLSEIFKKDEEEKKSNDTFSFKLIYPTKDYIVNQTHGGVEFANPLFMKTKQYNDPKFKKDIMHKFEGSDYYYWHTGCIPHLKIIIVTNSKMEINDDAIIYMGSHNFSLGAWGRIEKNGTQLSINNTELGVLYPPRKDSKKIKQEIIERLPFKFPPSKYAKEDSPWISEEYFEKDV